MKLKDLKLGDKIETYCAGEKVEGTVIKIDREFITVKHNPIRWGREEFTETIIKPSLWLQFSTSKTTPAAFYNNTLIEI